MNICGGEDVERIFVGRESDHGSADASMLEGGLKRYSRVSKRWKYDRRIL